MKNEQQVALNCSNKVLICMRTDEKWVHDFALNCSIKVPICVRTDNKKESTSCLEPFKRQSPCLYRNWFFFKESTSCLELFKQSPHQRENRWKMSQRDCLQLCKVLICVRTDWKKMSQRDCLQLCKVLICVRTDWKKMSQQVALNCSKSSSVWELIKKKKKKRVNKLLWTVQTKSSPVCEQVKQKQTNKNESTSCLELF